MINQAAEFLSRVITNLIMAITGEAPLDPQTLFTIILVGVLVVGIGAMVVLRMLRPVPLPPIIVNNAAPPPNPMVPVMVTFIILIVVIGGGLFIYLAR